jgi:hypothetical protein
MLMWNTKFVFALLGPAIANPFLKFQSTAKNQWIQMLVSFSRLPGGTTRMFDIDFAQKSIR